MESPNTTKHQKGYGPAILLFIVVMVIGRTILSIRSTNTKPVQENRVVATKSSFAP